MRIQFLMGSEGVLGFVLLSASVSWILSIYPVLDHRRSLAHESRLIYLGEKKDIRRLEQVPDSDLQEILLGLASQMTTYRNELTQFPIAYYFTEDEDRSKLASILPYLSSIAQKSINRGGVPIAATALSGAIDDYLQTIATRFLHRGLKNREEI